MLAERDPVCLRRVARRLASRLVHPVRKSPDRPAWLDGGGQMAELVRAFDWSATALGPIDSWPGCLTTMVGVMLHSRQPMFLWWGSELIQIYNDAYVPSFGVGKHPRALGQRGRDCWQEIWPIIGPQIDDVLQRGKPCWFEDALVPIFRNGAIEDVYWTYGYSPVFDEAGRIAGVLVICNETTARVQATAAKEAARALVDHERERILRFFSQAPAGICLLRGPDFVFEFANEQYQRLVGRTDIVGKPLLEALPELVGQGFDDVLRQVVQSNETFFGHEVQVKLARERRAPQSLSDVYCTFIYSPMRDVNGAVEGVSVFALDVTPQVLARQKLEALASQLQRSAAERNALLATAQRERENAEHANRAKDEFLTTASHELRTPLTAILGWARLLRAGHLDPSGYLRGVETIERNALAQVRLIEDILDGSRIITGKLRLETRPLDLRRLVQAAVETVRPAADAKNIALCSEVDETAVHVVGDPERLQQVVWNLCNNAIKFTPKGGAVSVRLRRIGTDVELEVSDNGQGIAPDFLPHVFERFRQGEGSTTRRYGGLGLGLALVRHLIEAHGGSVSAESAGVGCGATFTARIPVQATFRKVESEPPAANRDVAATPLVVDLTGVSVLVVDDDPDSRALVATVLRGSGADVTTATNAMDALHHLSRAMPTLLLSDVGMPETDGYELMRRVRTELGAAGAAVPAIALTAYAREEDRRLAISAGFNHHVAKPVEPAALLRIVAGAAANRRASPASL
ncbi:MAG TPA: ATP-binding protein [Polyangiaceae bacterium]|nr:ATP-binding protein [Polyangiaceae bacterium]